MRVFAVSVAAVALVSTTAQGAMLCAKPRKDGSFSATVKIRTACKAGESQLNPADVGFCCQLSTTTSTSTTRTITTVTSTST